MLTRIYGTAFFIEGRARRSTSSASSRRARATTAASGASSTCSCSPSCRPAARSGSRPGWRCGTRCTELWREQNRRRGYREVKTPILYDVELCKQSGHWDKYRDHMYFTDVEDRPMGLKPMNCPAHIQIYDDERHSYRDLPVRYSEAGLVHRHEPSGTLHGLLRVRHITQDDAHIFCTEEQVQEEVVQCLRFGFFLYELFGFEPRLELSTRPEKRIGSDEMWDRAEGALAGALEAEGLEYELNPGDGAFYGPKIDLHMTDSIGRSWQLGTVQLDYSMPERFDLHLHRRRQRRAPPGDDPPRAAGLLRALHRDPDRALRRRAAGVAGAGAGDRAAGLRPLQRLRRIRAARAARGRARASSSTIAASRSARKIREAELRKIPYMLVVGEREQGDGAVSVREHHGGDLGSDGAGSSSRSACAGSYTATSLKPSKSSERRA